MFHHRLTWLSKSVAFSKSTIYPESKERLDFFYETQPIQVMVLDMSWQMHQTGCCTCFWLLLFAFSFSSNHMGSKSAMLTFQLMLMPGNNLQVITRMLCHTNSYYQSLRVSILLLHSLPWQSWFFALHFLSHSRLHQVPRTSPFIALSFFVYKGHRSLPGYSCAILHKSHRACMHMHRSKPLSWRHSHRWQPERRGKARQNLPAETCWSEASCCPRQLSNAYSACRCHELRTLQLLLQRSLQERISSSCPRDRDLEKLCSWRGQLRRQCIP